MSTDAEVIRFVRGVLGCGCPDEVFETIEIEETGGPTEDQPYHKRLEIGGRLLIYILETDEPDEVRRSLPALVQHGIRERDEKGLNRFRACLASDRYAAVSPVAGSLFADLDLPDDRIHLHVIPRDRVPPLPPSVSRP